MLVLDGNSLATSDVPGNIVLGGRSLLFLAHERGRTVPATLAPAVDLVQFDCRPSTQHVHDARRERADCAHSTDQGDDALLVIREAVGVETFADRRVSGFAFLVLVQHPLQRRAAAQTVFPRFGRDAGQCRLLIQSDDITLLVGTQDGPRWRYLVLVDPLQRPRLCRLKPPSAGPAVPTLAAPTRRNPLGSTPVETGGEGQLHTVAGTPGREALHRCRRRCPRR